MDVAEALKGGRLAEAIAAAKDAVRKAPADGRHRSVLFQLLCIQGNWEGAQTQLKLVGEFDIEATIWTGVCEKLLACEAERLAVFAGKVIPTLFGKPPEWVGGTMEALRLGVEGNWQAAADSQARALEAAPATAVRINDQEAAWVADGDSRFGPVLEAFVDGKYFWIPFEHVREVNFRPRTHLMDSIWAPADFRWLNEGVASGYIPVRYPGSERDADPLIQLGRKLNGANLPRIFSAARDNESFVTDAAEFGVLEIRSVRFGQPDAPMVFTLAGDEPEKTMLPTEPGEA